MLWIKNEKVCATCLFWLGRRTTSYSFVEVMDEAACCDLDVTNHLRDEEGCLYWSPITSKSPG